MVLYSRANIPRAIALALSVGFVACHVNTFTTKEASNNQSLYEASLKAERSGYWDKATKGFEQLTFQLPARDPLLPLAYYHLGYAHQKAAEYILSAQAYSRVPENFPEDTLAAEATYQAAYSYAQLWRHPDLDADYGTTALSTFQSFLNAYPDSPRRDDAMKEVAKLNEMFAEKNLKTGELYAKQRAFDSAIIYYRDVVLKYGQTPAAREALLGLVKAYRAIAYIEDASETCATLRTKYPGDRQVLSTCGPAPKTAAAPTP